MSDATRKWSVIEYVTEEVRRQGHDVSTHDGLIRVSWMLKAWVYALDESHETPVVRDMINVGKMVEAVKNFNGIRICAVRVGPRVCPPHTEVEHLLSRLLKKRDKLTPLEFYRAFEEIHPFVDGNGRTGKILLNWLNGTLDAPIFPPDDFWGEEIVNP